MRVCVSAMRFGGAFSPWLIASFYGLLSVCDCVVSSDPDYDYEVNMTHVACRRDRPIGNKASSALLTDLRVHLLKKRSYIQRCSTINHRGAARVLLLNFDESDACRLELEITSIKKQQQAGQHEAGHSMESVPVAT